MEKGLRAALSKFLAAKRRLKGISIEKYSHMELGFTKYRGGEENMECLLHIDTIGTFIEPTWEEAFEKLDSTLKEKGLD